LKFLAMRSFAALGIAGMKTHGWERAAPMALMGCAINE
jgi:hypothetical protein